MDTNKTMIKIGNIGLAVGAVMAFIGYITVFRAAARLNVGLAQGMLVVMIIGAILTVVFSIVDIVAAMKVNGSEKNLAIAKLILSLFVVLGIFVLAILGIIGSFVILILCIVSLNSLKNTTTYNNGMMYQNNMVNPNMMNQNMGNPNMMNPNMGNPNMMNPNMGNPNIMNPNMGNPNMGNPDGSMGPNGMMGPSGQLGQRHDNNNNMGQ